MEFDLFHLFNVLEAALLTAFLGAALYLAYAAARTRGGVWPLVLGVAAVVRLLLLGVSLVAVGFAFWSFAGSSPALTPDLPVTYETWLLIGGVIVLLSGVTELLLGLSLIVGGWREAGRRQKRS